MIKAPLDEKNVCPSAIVDDLTSCDNIFKDNNAVGFLNIGNVCNIPVMFSWHDNEMDIIFKNADDVEVASSELTKYADTIMKTSESMIVLRSRVPAKYIMKFYFKETEQIMKINKIYMAELRWVKRLSELKGAEIVMDLIITLSAIGLVIELLMY